MPKGAYVGRRGAPCQAEGAKKPHTVEVRGACSNVVRRLNDGEARQQAPSHLPGDSARHGERDRSAFDWPYCPYNLIESPLGTPTWILAPPLVVYSPWRNTLV